jgi:redox-sensitive bicupin YhaK (pirin superfamily)
MSADSVETVIVPATRDLGDGFQVRRALPSAKRRMVGPFVFFDQMGPALLAAGNGLDVRPHPHIGLATVTYLFEGEICHRDSLGTALSIRPGELNWMTAGRGIVHSERTPSPLRAVDSNVFGIQAWVALPRKDEECAPAFAHHGEAELPLVQDTGVRVRVIAGSAFGASSPAETRSALFYADVHLDPRARLAVPAEHVERGAYVVNGRVRVDADGEPFDAGQLVVFKPGSQVTLRAGASGARLMLLGGEPLDGPRHVWWNFVSSSRERIEQAKAAWEAGEFAPVPGDPEFIPLPKQVPGAVHYP